MNERFLSRGKRKDNGAWVEGYYACQSNHSCIPSALKYQHFIFKDVFMDFNLGGLGEYEVIPGTVGQCTGRKYANDKLLFEGDIVKWYSDYDDTWGYSHTAEYYGVVVWNANDYCWNIKVNDELIPFNDYDWDISMVVGNIHDNPELLQRSDEE